MHASPSLSPPQPAFRAPALPRLPHAWTHSHLPPQPPPTPPQLLLVRGKDAVCDAIRDRRGSKPLPPEPGRVADMPLFCTAYHDRLSIYRDMSGASLHRRAAAAAAASAAVAAAAPKQAPP